MWDVCGAHVRDTCVHGTREWDTLVQDTCDTCVGHVRAWDTSGTRVRDTRVTHVCGTQAPSTVPLLPRCVRVPDTLRSPETPFLGPAHVLLGGLSKARGSTNCALTRPPSDSFRGSCGALWREASREGAPGPGARARLHVPSHRPGGSASADEFYGRRPLSKLCLGKTKYPVHQETYSENTVCSERRDNTFAWMGCPPPARRRTSFLSCAGTWLKPSQACQNRMFSSLNSFLRKSWGRCRP